MEANQKVIAKDRVSSLPKQRLTCVTGAASEQQSLQMAKLHLQSHILVQGIGYDALMDEALTKGHLE